MTNELIDARNRFSATHPEKRFDLNGRNWGVIDAGSGLSTLVLIPGTLGRADIFWNQIAALEGKVRLIALSYPDGGGIVEWTSDIAALLDRLQIDAANVLGSSLGGYLAQYFAAEHPDRMKKLFAANTLHSVREVTARPPYSLDLEKGSIDDLRTGFERALTAWAEAHPDQKDLVELLLQEAGGRILEGELRARLSALKFGPELPPVSLPGDRIVTIEADDDPLIPAEMRNAVRARLQPGVSYCFAWGGHFPYVVRPAPYTAILAGELDLGAKDTGWGSGGLRRQ